MSATVPGPIESPDAAIAAIATRLAPSAAALGVERIALAASRGRVLAEPVVADRDSPSVDHSAMDGYAVRLADLVTERDLPVLGESRPGTASPPMALLRGCIRVATGSPRPSGADAVVPRERAIERTNERGEVTAITVCPEASPGFGDHWRLRGENAPAGATLVEAGTLVGAAAAATMAACGVARPKVRRKVRVTILTTGDEVLAIDAAPTAERFRDSNGPGLAILLSSRPWLEVIHHEHLADDAVRLEAALSVAIVAGDAVVLTGGVSRGHRDFVRGAVEKLGCEIVFHRLPQRPGRPMLAAIARSERPVPIFGLPGNPLSALVTARRIVLPSLATIAGVRLPPPREVPVAVASDDPVPLWRFRLARLDADGSAWPLPIRSSGDVAAAGSSDGFLELAPGDRIEAGRRYPLFTWDG
jgi:molybdopterin molybdotransferase